MPEQLLHDDVVIVNGCIVNRFLTGLVVWYPALLTRWYPEGFQPLLWIPAEPSDVLWVQPKGSLNKALFSKTSLLRQVRWFSAVILIAFYSWFHARCFR